MSPTDRGAIQRTLATGVLALTALGTIEILRLGFAWAIPLFILSVLLPMPPGEKRNKTT